MLFRSPGELKAVNVNKKNESFILKTSGKPSAIRLVADRNNIEASKQDLSYVKIEIIDEAGNLVPDAELTVNIKSSGKGSVIASGNAAYADMESFRSYNPKTFRGKAIAIVQPNGEKGEIELTVSSQGLNDATTIITTN